MKAIVGVGAILALMTLPATDMEHKPRTVLMCRTANAGVAEIMCDNPGEWSFEAEASQDNGRDVVTVRIRSPKEAVPPPFGVYFRGSGADVQNVWTSDCSVNGDGRDQPREGARE